MNTKGMQKVGTGAFSTVYKKSKTKVLIKSRDRVKMCMSEGCFPDTQLFPSLIKVGSSDCGVFHYYEESFFAKVSSLKNNLSSFDWEFYKVLRDLNVYDWGSDCKFTHWHSQFDKIPNKFHHKRKMLKEALDGLANYGTDTCFEISPRNVTTRRGKLILLDCFFFQSDL